MDISASRYYRQPTPFTQPKHAFAFRPACRPLTRLSPMSLQPPPNQTLTNRINETNPRPGTE
jgi:hypothetical protein